MNTGKAVIAYCHPGVVEGLFHESVVQLLLHDQRKNKRVFNGGGIITLSTGPRIASARNRIVREFLKYPGAPEWLWMVDADMTFPPDTLDRLVQTAASNQLQLLGGLCFGGGRGGACFPTLYQLQPPDEDNRAVKIVEDYPEDSLVKVDATGAACLLIHRNTLEQIEKVFGEVDTPQGRIPSPAPWFAETFYAGREFGEDWTFCMRAAQVGIELTVHTGIKIGHVKPGLLDEEAFAEFKAKRTKLGSEQAVSLAHRKRALGV